MIDNHLNKTTNDLIVLFLVNILKINFPIEYKDNLEIFLIDLKINFKIVFIFLCF